MLVRATPHHLEHGQRDEEGGGVPADILERLEGIVSRQSFAVMEVLMMLTLNSSVILGIAVATIVCQ